MNANAIRTNNGKSLIAAILAIAMIVCAVAFVASPSDAADTTVSDNGTISFDSIQNGETITVSGTVTLNSNIDKDVIIKGTGDNAVISITSAIKITGNVTFENVKFSDGTNNETAHILMNPYLDYYVTEDLNITFNGVSFDTNCAEDTIYLSPMGPKNINVEVNNSDFTNGTIVYMVKANNNAYVTFNNTDGATVNFSSGNAGASTIPATIGNQNSNINLSDSTLETITIASDSDGYAQATISADSTVTVNEVNVGKNYGAAENNTGLNVAGTLNANTINNDSKIDVGSAGVLTAEEITSSNSNS